MQGFSPSAEGDQGSAFGFRKPLKRLDLNFRFLATVRQILAFSILVRNRQRGLPLPLKRLDLNFQFLGYRAANSIFNLHSIKGNPSLAGIPLFLSFRLKIHPFWSAFKARLDLNFRFLATERQILAFSILVRNHPSSLRSSIGILTRYSIKSSFCIFLESADIPAACIVSTALFIVFTNIFTF